MKKSKKDLRMVKLLKKHRKPSKVNPRLKAFGDKLTKGMVEGLNKKTENK